MIKTNISKFIILAALLFPACNIKENTDIPAGRIKVEAYFEESTRVSLTQDSHSQGMVARWQENDAVKVFLSNGASISDAGACRIENISEDGHKALFYYSIPNDFRIGDGHYYLYALSINSYPMVTDWELQCNGSIIRSPLSSFRAPVLFESDNVGTNSFGYFRHFGTYELLHVTNDSDADITFSLSGFQAGTIWFRTKGALKIPSMEFVVSSEAARTPVDASAPITIPAHSGDVIVSWYIPNGQKIKEARLYAKINGENVHTTNLLNSDVIPQIGHAYHMYVTWDGKALSYTRNSTASIEVETVSSTFDPDSFTCNLVGSVTNTLASNVKDAGFRLWKENDPENYVEYDAALAEDNAFSLSLGYNDFVNISGDFPVKGQYRVSAFVIDKNGNRYHGNILEFTIDKERPESALIVETLAADVNNQHISVYLTGSVTNRSLDGLITGFRIWKDGHNMDSVEFNSTYTSDNVFGVDLSVNDLVYTSTNAGESLYGLYKAQAYAIDSNVTSFGNIIEFTVTKPAEQGFPEAIDLGLPSGLKWASFNLGASKPEGKGDFFAWGETEPYYSSQDPLVWKEGKEAGYSWASNKWCKGSATKLTKYCTSSDIAYNGVVDWKRVLDLEDDAAHVNLGDHWRMPTEEEWTELRKQCNWIWTSVNGVYGREVTGPSGKSIFLPAAGCMDGTNLSDAGSLGYYWSSYLLSFSLYARLVSFDSSKVNSDDRHRCYGHSIRPVCTK